MLTVPDGHDGGGQKAILIDTTRCRGCNLCVEACRRKNGQPIRDTWPSGLSPETYTYVREVRNETYYAKRQCMHCVNPSCVSVCPVAAMRKSKAGPVYYEANRCFGCRYCELACPYQVPRYEWDELWPRVTKCNMCRERVESGGLPACVAACRFRALTFGDRERMLAEAHRRIARGPETYVNHVYGEHELGGTCVLYLSSVPFEELGLPEMPEEAPPQHTWDDTVKLPWVMGGGVVLLTSAWLATMDRRETSKKGGQRAKGAGS
jgi:formate dehydrogenase iron-sulfur subunit